MQKKKLNTGNILNKKYAKTNWLNISNQNHPTWAVCNLIDMKSITTYHTTNKWKTILWNQMWMIVLYFHYEKYQNIYSKYNVLCSPKKQKQLPIFAKSKSLMQFLECLLKQSATKIYQIHTQPFAIEKNIDHTKPISPPQPLSTTTPTNQPTSSTTIVYQLLLQLLLSQQFQKISIYQSPTIQNANKMVKIYLKFAS